MLNDLHIHWKLSLLSMLFLCPVILLTFLLVNQSVGDITFSSKERDGTRYLTVLRDGAMQVALGDEAGTRKNLLQLHAVDRAVGAGMNLGPLPGQVAALMGATAGRRDAGAAPAMDAIDELVSRVGDGSNLILDPDLDSYYSMSLVLLKLPLALRQSFDIAQTSASLHPLDAVQASGSFQAKLNELRTTLDGIERDLAGAYRGNPDGSLRKTFALPFAHYRETAENYLQQVAAHVAQPSPASASAFEQANKQLIGQHRIVGQLVSDQLDRLLDTRIDALEQTLVLSLGATALVLALAAILALLIWRSVTRPISALVEQMGKIAAGDLTCAAPVSARADEIGLLTRTAAAMQYKLHSLTREVRDTANKVELGAQTMGAAVNEQAASASEVSTTVTEIASTMEELSVTSNQIAEHAKAVAGIANHTWETSKKGSAAMQDLSARMGDIRSENHGSLEEIATLGSKSKEISKVMVLINAVADQTKLIAFNAALEASSAGEAGRRFGVVAAEIRRLADSVTASTGEIETRISEIQDSINRLVITSEKGTLGIIEGMRATSSTAERLEELVSAASQASEAAQQISLSTQQQKGASGQVVLALREIVNASANGAESMAHAAEISRSMQASSDELRQVVGQFKLEDAATPPPCATGQRKERP